MKTNNTTVKKNSQSKRQTILIIGNITITKSKILHNKNEKDDKGNG